MVFTRKDGIFMGELLVSGRVIHLLWVAIAMYFHYGHSMETETAEGSPPAHDSRLLTTTPEHMPSRT